MYLCTCILLYNTFENEFVILMFPTHIYTKKKKKKKKKEQIPHLKKKNLTSSFDIKIPLG